MKYKMNNNKVLITGASGGIGESLCKKFIESNAIIICTSSDTEKLKNLKNLYGSDHHYYLLNFTDKDSISDSVKQISEDHDDIDTLINNAGTTSDNLFLRMKDEQWHDVIDINLNSNYYIIKGILPNMIKKKEGNIIGITSVVAFTGNPGQSNYSSSKSAIIAMYKSIALEVAQRNIRVNTIAPGFIKTFMTDKLNDIQKDAIMKKIPMKKFGEPNDVANLALFLSSKSSSYITGQTFHINGGMLMV